MQRSNVFQCDEKYQNYVEELQSRGWELTAADRDLPIPAAVNFICKNLVRLKFATVFDRHVNHLRGSQNLSNKAYLTYHLQSCGLVHVLPPTWSSAIGNMSQLIGMLLVHEAVSLSAAFRAAQSFAEVAALRSRIAQLQEVINALNHCKDYACTSEARQVAGAFTALAAAADGTAADAADAALQRCEVFDACDKTTTRNIWLIKAVGMSCGDSIVIKSSLVEILQAVQDMNYKCVVQKYIERPLLVRSGIKFDIRQWVLVTSANPLVIYGFSQCYLRLSTQLYNLDEESLANNLVHLTNNAIQKKAVVDSTPEETENHLHHPLMMTQSQFASYLRERAVREGTEGKRGGESDDVFNSVLIPQMRQLTIAAVGSTRDKLEKVGRGYEWLGLDFMVTESLQMKLLEVNTSPDTSYSTPITEWLVKAATRDLMDLILDEKLTTLSEIIKCKGVRSVVVESMIGDDCDSVHTRQRWDLWHFGPIETKAQMQALSSQKIDTLGVMDTEHKPKQLNYLNATLSCLRPSFSETLASNDEHDEEEL